MVAEHLPLFHRYCNASRRDAPFVRVEMGSPRRLARSLRALVRDVDGRVTILADETTAAAAPELIDAAPHPDALSVLPGTPRPVPRVEIAQELADAMRRARSRVMVTVGGGTITDIGKHAALLAGTSVVVVPTAASVDAYTSARAALRIAGYHRTPDAQLPTLALVSPAIVEAAPTAITLAGCGDLVAKLLARLDWRVSAMITGEPFSERESAWSVRAARGALARLRRTGPDGAAMDALDALFVSGRAMRLAGSSRPAASAEHTIAHLWEVALGERIESYHGTEVAIATRCVAGAYRAIARRLREGSRLRAWSPEAHAYPDRIPGEMRQFEGKMREECAAGLADADAVARRRERIERFRLPIADEADALLDEVERGLDALDAAGLTVGSSPIPHQWVALALQWVRYLRDRYSLFHLAFEAGWEEEILGEIGVDPA